MSDTENTTETTAASFTPGPWCAVFDATSFPLVMHGQGAYTAVACVVACEDEQANARLIAAAPEMLAEIEYFYSLCLQSEAQGSEEAAEDVDRLAALLQKIRNT